MKITHVTSTDLQGGAARSAYRLHQGLVRAGAESKMFVEFRESDDPNVVAFRYPAGQLSRIRRLIRRLSLNRAARKLTLARAWNSSPFGDDRSRHGVQILEQLPLWDILHLHWVAGMFDYSEFFRRVPQDRPIVWTLHDMHPFTGGCHFSGNCTRFLESCGSCPQLNSSDPRDFSRQSWARKRSGYQALRPGRIHLVTPSKWLAGEVRRSSLLSNCEVSIIPYGLDTGVFKPRDRAAARELFELPADRQIVLFLADRANEHRKGLPLLAEALKALPDRSNLCLLILGNGRVDLPEGFQAVRLEYVRNDHVLSLIYSAADVFALPVLQDNLPNTALEAMACGLPIVAFATGGVPDMVRDAVEGWVVPQGDVAALGQAIASALLDHRRRALMASNARLRAVQEYGIDLQAQRYLDLYRSLNQRSC